MHIRQARSDDAAAACAVLRASITELCAADHGDDPALLARWLANKTPEHVAGWIAGGAVLVAEQDGAIAGVAMADAGHVMLNYVAPGFRFRGVSKALLARLEQRAGELGCRDVTLESTKTAESFYWSLGYRPVDGSDGKRILRKVLADAGS